MDTERPNIVPVPAGTLSEKDYEDLVVGAMLSPEETAASGEPVVDVTPSPAAEAAPKAKPPRACSKCGHPDGNSVGKIRRGRMAEKWDEERGVRAFFVEWFCQPCLDEEATLPEAERDPRPVGKGGYLIALCALRNKEEAKRHAVRTAKERYQEAKATWRAILAGEKPFENAQPQPGCCEFSGCEDKVDSEAFAVVNGELRRFCALHSETLREQKVRGQNKDPRFMAWRGPEAEVKCQRHLAWLRHQAKEAERRATPASSGRVERLKDAFDRRLTDRRPNKPSSVGETTESQRAKERQAAYVEALKNGGSLADVLAVPEKLDESDGGWAAIDAFNRRSEATCAGHRGKGGKPKKDGKKGGGKGKRR